MFCNNGEETFETVWRRGLDGTYGSRRLCIRDEHNIAQGKQFRISLPQTSLDKLPEIFDRLRRIDPGIPVPRGLPHLSEFADEVENLEKKYFRFLWNIKNRTECNDDALYIGIVLSVLKKQGNAYAIKDSLEIVDMMEKEYNAYRITKQCP